MSVTRAMSGVGRKHQGSLRGALARRTLAASLGLAVVAAPPGAWAQAAAEDSDAPVRATVRQLRDAWLSVDVVVTGTYAGVDSSLGAIYHALDIDEVWMGTPRDGRLWFKAPRGVNLSPGQEGLFMLWDRLNGATDSYLENATRLHGDDAWRLVGPDSLAAYLLPFARYAFRFDGNRIRLRGTGTTRNEMKRSELHGLLLDYELTLLPTAQFEKADLVVRARVRAVDKRKREIDDIAIEFRIHADFEVLGTLKGDPPAALRLEFSSFPRSPRFDVDEEVILFLSEVEEQYFLAKGKRGVYHVVDGVVAETGQPFPEFARSLQNRGD